MDNQTIAPFNLTIITTWGQVVRLDHKPLSLLLNCALDLKNSHTILRKDSTIIMELKP